MTCSNCKVSNNTKPASWAGIGEVQILDDTSGGTEWQQFKCTSCGSLENLAYKDVGMNRSGWFYKNYLPTDLDPSLQNS